MNLCNTRNLGNLFNPPPPLFPPTDPFPIDFHEIPNLITYKNRVLNFVNYKQIYAFLLGVHVQDHITETYSIF